MARRNAGAQDRFRFVHDHRGCGQVPGKYADLCVVDYPVSETDHDTLTVPVNLKEQDAFHLTIEEYLLALISMVEELVRTPRHQYCNFRDVVADIFAVASGC